MNQPSFSGGAAYADLDNDGDLDYVISNINSIASIYKNNLYQSGKNSDNSFLRIKLIGDKNGAITLGSTIKVFYDSGKIQFAEHNIYRGYISTVEDVIHFGLGKNKKLDCIKIVWRDGKFELLKNVEVTMNVFERLSEIGTLRALGDYESDIRSLFITESFLMGILSIVRAVPLSFIAIHIISGIHFQVMLPLASQAMDIKIIPSWDSFLEASLVCLLSAVASSLWPAHKGSKISVVTALAAKI